MAILKTEFFYDKVRVHYFLGKKLGYADERGTMDVPYNSIATLEPISQQKCVGVEEIFVPQVNLTIVFIDCIDDVEDTSYDHYMRGPYLKVEKSPENVEQDVAQTPVQEAIGKTDISNCPLCGKELKHSFSEQETAAGDNVNEYRVSKCSNPDCGYEEEECVGGHCNDNPLSGWSGL